MAVKLAVNKDWQGKALSFTHRRGVITLNDRVTPTELEILYRLGHPAVFVVKDEPKKKDVKNDAD